jgi:hypothetical protein
MYWTQCIYGRKYKFYNPLRQNFAHIKAIEGALLQYRLNSPIHSLVVFPTASKIIVDGTNEVGDTSHALEVLLSYKDAVYSENEYYQIIKLIQAARITDSHLRSVHNEQVNALINSRALAQVKVCYFQPQKFEKRQVAILKKRKTSLKTNLWSYLMTRILSQ